MSFDLQSALQDYLNQLSLRHCSPGTIRTRSIHLRAFVHWSSSRGILLPEELSTDLLVDYQFQLISRRTILGTSLCISTQHSYLLSIRGWLRWLAKQGFVANDLPTSIALPKPGYRLPRNLSASDIERVFECCFLRTSTGLRDRAILETFYSTGIRRIELLNLRTHDLDWHRELLTVRMGKGRKDRVIPIGERALAWIDRYLWEVRPRFQNPVDDGTLFITRAGRPFTPNHLSLLSRKLIATAFPNIQGACHLFRHSMATLMLEGGADIRFIQQMLGHSKLTSTQIYAHVSVKTLKEVHTKTHPGARLRAFTKESLRAAAGSINRRLSEGTEHT